MTQHRISRAKNKRIVSIICLLVARPIPIEMPHIAMKYLTAYSTVYYCLKLGEGKYL
jgi:hypothetical protein